MQSIAERAVLWSIMLSGLAFVLVRVGLENDLLELAPLALLALAALVALAMIAQMRRLNIFNNRLRGHVLGWILAAGVAYLLSLANEKTVQAAMPAIKSYRKLWKTLDGFADFLIPMFLLFAVVLLIVGTRDTKLDRPGRIERALVSKLPAKIAAIPMAFTAIGVFVIATLWTVYHSFTRSKLLPKSDFEGVFQYERLWSTDRWWISLENLAIYGACSMVFSLVIGFTLATLLDQKIRGEAVFRTILLYPFALSFIVTGLVWQWILTPEFGVQNIVRSLGFENFVFDPLYNSDIVIYGVLIAGLWQGTGFIMVLMLAGLRGIDQDIWKASRVDGIPTWKTYIYIIIPMMRPVFITTLVIIASGIVKVYDLVVAQTSGGPGLSSEVPAKYVYDYMFGGQNLGQGFAASTVMLALVLIPLIPFAYLEFGNRKNG
jgi:glucose/mannose transport system permease protein